MAALLVALGLYWFQPWRLFTTTVVHDQLPVLAADVARTSPGPPTSSTPTSPRPITPAGTQSPSATSGRPASSQPAPNLQATPSRSVPPTSTLSSSVAPRATELAHGQLISHEHDTSGTVRLIKLADGHRVLTLEGLRTSDGPALHVWLTDQAVIAGSDGWHVFDDGRHVDLGSLKGNQGDQVYPVADGTDLTGLTSVTIWCERFSVSFGAATLTAA